MAENRYNKRIVLDFDVDENISVIKNQSYKNDEEKSLDMDIYLPVNYEDKADLPCVIFIHGGPVKNVSPKDWGAFISWGEYAAVNNLAGITFNHRFDTISDIGVSEQDIIDCIDYVRSAADKYNIDKNKICLFALSGGGALLSFAFREKLDYVKCIAAYYPMMDLSSYKKLPEEIKENYSPVNFMEKSIPAYPVYIAKANKDMKRVNDSIDAFVEKAVSVGADITLTVHENGRHGFDIMTDDDRSREIIRDTMCFIKENTI